jgi:hypothetical protein
VVQHEPGDARRQENEAKALACIEEEDLGVTSISELATLTEPENYAEVMRCKIIAFKGYDPLEHPASLQPKN